MLLALQLNNLLGDPAAMAEVPDVVGDAEADAITELEGAGFAVSVLTAHSDSVPVGDVISQTPAGGAEALEGSLVTIRVSLGVGSGAGGYPLLWRRRRR
jgi:serine/threonine-protein kinase